jgi:hypothetical protein
MSSAPSRHCMDAADTSRTYAQQHAKARSAIKRRFVHSFFLIAELPSEPPVEPWKLEPPPCFKGTCFPLIPSQNVASLF